MSESIRPQDPQLTPPDGPRVSPTRPGRPTDAPLILASTSPRRIALMKEHGFDVAVIAPPWDEPEWIGSNLSPPQRAEAMSYFKARSVADRLTRGRVLAGDTIVALGNRVFGKPTDRDDARSILTTLSGTTHHVITGVTLYDITTDSGCPILAPAGVGDGGPTVRLIRHDTTAVTMRRLTDVELQAYLDTGDWAGKAGAYGIQDSGDAFIDRIEGSFSNVVGFPMELIRQMLTVDPPP